MKTKELEQNLQKILETATIEKEHHLKWMVWKKK